MSRRGEVWRLHAGETLVADLVVTGGDFPWLTAAVEGQPALAAFRPLFDEEWAVTEAEDWDRADTLVREITDNLTLTDPQGVRVAEFLLHIQGDEAWWRWSYEPFEDRGR